MTKESPFPAVYKGRLVDLYRRAKAEGRFPSFKEKQDLINELTTQESLELWLIAEEYFNPPETRQISKQEMEILWSFVKSPERN